MSAAESARQTGILADMLAAPGEMDQKLAGAIISTLKRGDRPMLAIPEGRVAGVERGLGLTDAESRAFAPAGREALEAAKEKGLMRMWNDYLVANNDQSALNYIRSNYQSGSSPLSHYNSRGLGIDIVNPEREATDVVGNLAEAMRDPSVLRLRWELLEEGSERNLRGHAAQALKDRGFTGTMAQDEMRGLAMAILDPNYLRHRYFDYLSED